MADSEALFTPELVFFDWECATPDEVFARLEDELAPRGYIAPGWLDAVRTREDAYPTGLGHAGGQHRHPAHRSRICG